MRNRIVIGLAVIGLIVGINAYTSYAKAPEYETVSVSRAQISQVVLASGEVKSDEEVELKFPVSGKLVKLAVKKNERVKKWSLIASLDKKELQKNLERSLRDYAKERTDFDQNEQVTYKDVVETDTIKRILRKNQFDLEKAVLDVELTDFAIKNANLFSPIAGVVTKVHTQEGTSVIAGTAPIVTIADPDKVAFVAEVGESDIANVSPAQEAVIELDAYPEQKFNGKVIEVDFAATKTNGNKAYLVKIAFDQQLAVKLDMSGEAEITTVSHENALVIPKQVIQEKQGKKYAEILKSGKLTQVEITTGLKGKGGMIEVLSGLDEGEQVVLPPKKK